MRKPWLPLMSALITAAAGITLAFTVPASGASVAQESPPKPMITIVGKGDILNAGRYVGVRLRIRCQGTATITVSLAQRKPGRTVTGSGTLGRVTCTGEDQDITVLVSADAPYLFTPGMAEGNAELTACTDGGCVSGTDNRQLHLG